MSTNEPWRRPVVELADAVRAGEQKAIDLVDLCLARIERAQDDLNAFVHVDAEGARRRAREVDESVAGGTDPGPLAGVPFGVKELEPVAGWPYSEACQVFTDRIAEYDSTQVTRLKASGAIPIGMTAAPEFGSISYTRSHVHGTTRNPWNRERTPGGSSGGSAAAVAAGLVPFCTGSDGGGSIRIPCSYSGLFGLKPSWGRISHGPRVHGADLTAVVGPMTTTVRDAARYLDCVVGVDVHDRWSVPAPDLSYEAVLDAFELTGLRVAWSASLGHGRCDPDVEQGAHEAAEALVAAAGFRFVHRPLDLPGPATAWGILGGPDIFPPPAPHLPDRA